MSERLAGAGDHPTLAPRSNVIAFPVRPKGMPAICPELKKFRDVAVAFGHEREFDERVARRKEIHVDALNEVTKPATAPSAKQAAFDGIARILVGPTGDDPATIAWTALLCRRLLAAEAAAGSGGAA